MSPKYPKDKFVYNRLFNLFGQRLFLHSLNIKKNNKFCFGAVIHLVCEPEVESITLKLILWFLQAFWQWPDNSSGS